MVVEHNKNSLSWSEHHAHMLWQTKGKRTAMKLAHHHIILHHPICEPKQEQKLSVDMVASKGNPSVDGITIDVNEFNNCKINIPA